MFKRKEGAVTKAFWTILKNCKIGTPGRPLPCNSVWSSFRYCFLLAILVKENTLGQNLIMGSGVKYLSSKLNGNGQGLRTWTKRKGTRGFDLPLRGILSGMLFWALDYGTAGWWEDIAAQAPHVNGQLGKSKTTPCRRVNRRLVSGNVRLCEEDHSASDSWDCKLKLHFFLTNFKLSFCIRI